MAQRVGVLAAKPDDWSFPKSVWWEETTSVKKAGL